MRWRYLHFTFPSFAVSLPSSCWVMACYIHEHVYDLNRSTTVHLTW